MRMKDRTKVIRDTITMMTIWGVVSMFQGGVSGYSIGKCSAAYNYYDRLIP